MISFSAAWAQVPATEQMALPEWGQALVDALGIQSGSTVADVGAGRGTFLPIWSVAVGSTGHVIAEDIDKFSLEQARKKTNGRYYPNVEFVLGTAKDTTLPAGCADLIVVIDAYHHFAYPSDMLASLAKALKTSGRLAIIEFYKTDKPTRGFPMPGHIRLNRDEVISEILSNGFRLLSTRDYSEGHQYIAIFVQDPQRVLKRLPFTLVSRDHNSSPP
jgi:ubiquinone/menaquinone biosynthesis C-methylase UbiE